MFSSNHNGKIEVSVIMTSVSKATDQQCCSHTRLASVFKQCSEVAHERAAPINVIKNYKKILLPLVIQYAVNLENTRFSFFLSGLEKMYSLVHENIYFFFFRVSLTVQWITYMLSLPSRNGSVKISQNGETASLFLLMLVVPKGENLISLIYPKKVLRSQ